MSEQTKEPVPETREQTETDPRQDGQTGPVGSVTRPPGAQQCPSCGAKNHASASVCLGCGEQLRQRPKKIRCRQCGQPASSSLTLCPNCGRELQAAPSRFWTWVVPVGVILLLTIFWLSRNVGPALWAENQMNHAIAWVSGMGAEMDPHMTIVLTPESDTPLLELVRSGNEDAGQPAATEVETARGEPNTADSGTTGSDTMDADTVISGTSGGEVVVALLPTDTPVPTPTDTAQPEPTATSTEMPTATPTETPTKKPTEAPTKKPTATAAPSRRLTASPTRKAVATTSALKSSTPTSAARAADEDDAEAAADSDLLILQPTATSEVASAALSLVPTSEPTSAPASEAEARLYTVLSGDTLLSIAQRFGTSVETLMAVNDIAPDEAYTLKVGETLKIVANDDAPVVQTYTIRPGDTFVTIAGRFGVSTADLQAANGFTDDQVRLLRPGQTLTIPLDDDVGSAAIALAPTKVPASPTPSPTSAPTAAPTATPTATTSPLRLDAPALRSPENSTVVSCQGSGQMAWGAVDFMMPTDEFVMHLGFVSSKDESGNEAITWVLNQQRPSNRASWEMDSGLCGLAPQEYGRQWRWYVEIVDEEGVVVSPPSETWGFSWN